MYFTAHRAEREKFLTNRIWIGVAVLLVFSSAASAQGENGWVDVNFGAAKAAQDTYGTDTQRIVFSETASFGADYFFPRGASFDFGGGYMFTPVVGVGVSFSGTAHSDTPLLSIRIPHPNFFNAFASDAGEGDTSLDRVEGVFHIQAMINALPDSQKLRVRLFVGPSHFRVTQDTVRDIRYSQVFGILNTSNTVDITDYTFNEAEGTGWGFHAGGDVAYFFTRVVGVGGFLRVSRATVDLEDFSGSSEVKAGGVQFGGGLRLKF